MYAKLIFLLLSLYLRLSGLKKELSNTDLNLFDLQRVNLADCFYGSGLKLLLETDR